MALLKKQQVFTSFFLCYVHIYFTVLTVPALDAFSILLPSWKQSSSRKTHRLFHANASPSSQYDNVFYTLTVSYEGKSTQIHLSSNETVLSALERSNVAATLSLPEMPSDCRRGNCLTCAAKCRDETAPLRRGEDGLSPHLSKHVEKRGYVLTCSSFIQGNGVELELNKNADAWNEVYQLRIQDEATQLVAQAAVAKTIRMYDERHVEEWAKETEQVYQKSGAEL